MMMGVGGFYQKSTHHVKNVPEVVVKVVSSVSPMSVEKNYA